MSAMTPLGGLTTTCRSASRTENYTPKSKRSLFCDWRVGISDWASCVLPTSSQELSSTGVFVTMGALLEWWVKTREVALGYRIVAGTFGDPRQLVRPSRDVNQGWFPQALLCVESRIIDRRTVRECAIVVDGQRIHGLLLTSRTSWKPLHIRRRQR